MHYRNRVNTNVESYVVHILSIEGSIEVGTYKCAEELRYAEPARDVGVEVDVFRIKVDILSCIVDNHLREGNPNLLPSRYLIRWVIKHPPIILPQLSNKWFDSKRNLIGYVHCRVSVGLHFLFNYGDSKFFVHGEIIPH